MQPVHQRMSVIIAAQDYRSWLDKNTNQEDLHSILDRDGYRQLQLAPISTRVNNPAHNDPGILKAVSLAMDDMA